MRNPQSGNLYWIFFAWISQEYSLHSFIYFVYTDRQAKRQAGRQEREVSRQRGKKAGRQATRQAGSKTERETTNRQTDRQTQAGKQIDNRKTCTCRPPFKRGSSKKMFYCFLFSVYYQITKDDIHITQKNYQTQYLVETSIKITMMALPCVCTGVRIRFRKS